MLAKASSSVAPCDQQPGRPGQETLYPSSVRIKATGYLISLTVACRPRTHRRDAENAEKSLPISPSPRPPAVLCHVPASATCLQKQLSIPTPQLLSKTGSTRRARPNGET